MNTQASKSPALITLILLCGLSVLSLTMFLPSLANIAATLEADYALINLSIAGYAAMTAIVQLIAGPMSDRFGRRPVMLWALVVFSVASLGCLFSESVWAFLGFRMMQAAIISGYAISMAAVRDTHSTEKAASLIGYMTSVWAIAPMLGPMIGGVLDDEFSWRASFVVLTGMGIAMIALCWVNLYETNTSPARSFRAQSKAYHELVTSRRFWGYSLTMAFCNAAFYVFLGGAPLVAKFAFNISTSELGFYMGTITIGFVLGSFMAGRLADNRALTSTMLAGRMIACAGLTTGLAIWYAGLSNANLYFLACASVGIGNGLTVSPSAAGVMSVKPELAGSAAGLNGALAVTLGAIMSGISGVIFTQANVEYSLILIMLILSGFGMLSTFFVMWIDRKAVN